MREISLKGLRKKADNTFAKYIRTRDGVICCCCNQIKDTITCGHWIPKTNANWGTRYDERNSHSQCWYCNSWAHPQDEYAEFMLQRYGRKVMLKLKEQKHLSLVEFVTNILHIYCKDTREAYTIIIEYYENKLEELKNKS